jgi:hypothetical protein
MSLSHIEIVPAAALPAGGHRPEPQGVPMSLNYEQRVARVEQVLATEKVKPGNKKTLSDLAVKVLYALDSGKENVR